MAREVALLGLFSDIASWRRFRAIAGAGSTAAAGKEFAFRLRALHGQEVWLRAGSSDPEVLFYTFFHRFHLPSKGMKLDRATCRTIVDLGANIGFTMAHFAVRYPRALVLGLELDADNARLCRRNTLSFGERCRVFELAAWSHDCEVSYEVRSGGEDAYSAREQLPSRSGTRKTARAISLDRFFAEQGIESVDLLKMDVEGAESLLLAGSPSWIALVRSLKVEVHGNYSVSAAKLDLKRLGFDVTTDRSHPSCVIGVRRSSVTW